MCLMLEFINIFHNKVTFFNQTKVEIISFSIFFIIYSTQIIDNRPLVIFACLR